ncbi:uncharacterized protein BJ171DRAFT_137408 [Polychytrium aggregatum]|uniref:uncharacterized protein n=1 Tax=Polychytrium aggregatum TaxID=110093 RepID=UPI0022FE155B|nr:uncharacterized protein BJ171DRAFT_137408 [Polychytrium aggregatum]KAI9203607.1 hypothetical protein BJ171DRAFT_137408 [Polychytrium aggregatum]
MSSWCYHHSSRDHDVFISYRVKSEQPLADELCSSLQLASGRRLGSQAQAAKVFLDKRCLSPGEVFVTNFLSALENTANIIYLLSRQSLDIMVDNLSRGISDNVLAEIVQGLELSAQRPQIKLYPVCVMSQNDDGYDRFLAFAYPVPEGDSFQPMRDALRELCTRQVMHINPAAIGSFVYSFLNLTGLCSVSPGVDDSGRPVSLAIASDALERDDLADEIYNNLACRSGVCIISGAGGMGKSTLCRQFAKRTFEQDRVYESVFWISCSSEWQAFADMAGLLGYTSSSSDDDESQEAHENGTQSKDVVLKAARKLGTETRYLLIIDNVDDIDVANECLGKITRYTGDVIVTTRYESLPQGAFLNALQNSTSSRSQNIVSLRSWPMNTAEGYILRRCESLSMLSPEEKVILRQILETLDGLPLVIEQFISYYQTFQPPLELIQHNFSKVLAHDEQSSVENAKSNVKKLVQLSLDSLLKGFGANGRAAVELFVASGYLFPQLISFPLLEAILKSLRPDLGDNAFEIVVLMNQTGLLRKIGSGYSVHGIYQYVARELIDDPEYKLSSIPAIVADTLLKLVGFPPFTPKQMEFGTHLLFYAHIHKDRPYTVTKNIYVDQTSAQLMLRQRYYRQAEQILESAIPRACTLLESRTHILVVKLLGIMASVASQLSNYEKSLSYQKECLEFYMSEGTDKQRRFVPQILNRMSWTCRLLGDYESAIKYNKEALSLIASLTNSQQHPQAATAMGSLGTIYKALGRFDEALQFMEESLKIKIRVYGTRDRLEVSHVLSGLGSLYHIQGNFVKANQVFSEALAIIQKHSSADASRSVFVQQCVAECHLSQGRYQEAMDTLVQAEKSVTQTYGSGSPGLATIWRDMGILLRAWGRCSEASAYFQKALTLQIESQATREQVEVARTMDQFGLLKIQQREYDAAKQLLEESIEIKRSCFGNRPHSLIAQCLDFLGKLECDRGQCEQAIEYHNEALKTNTQFFGSSQHPLISHTICDLGWAYIGLGRYDEAHQMFKDAYDYRLHVFGPQHYYVGKAQFGLATVALKRHRPAEARERCLKALEILEDVYEDRPNEDVAKCYKLLGEIQHACYQYRPSLEHYRQALQIYTQLSDPTLGPRHEAQELEEAMSAVSAEMGSPTGYIRSIGVGLGGSALGLRPEVTVLAVGAVCTVALALVMQHYRIRR